MNHCYDCNSSYSTPGTCNCFAPGGKRYAGTQGGTFAPWTPGFIPLYVPPLSPTIAPQPSTYPWGTTITGSDAGATSYTTVMS